MLATSFKVKLEREKDPTIHRFRGAYTFDEFQTIIAHLWGSAPRTFTVQYEDDEGDLVQLSNQSEWKECINLHVTATADADRGVMQPLRMSVKKAKSKAQYADPAAEVAVPTAPQAMAAEAEVTFNVPEPKKSAVVHLLSILYRCNAAEDVMNGNDWMFEPIISRDPGVPSPDVSLTLSDAALFDHAFNWTRQAIAEKRFDFAETALRAAISVFPDNKVFEYQMACTCSHQGHLDESMKFLRLAVAHGYDNPAHLARDPDLETVRYHQDFAELTGEGEADEDENFEDYQYEDEYTYEDDAFGVDAEAIRRQVAQRTVKEADAKREAQRREQELLDHQLAAFLSGEELLKTNPEWPPRMPITKTPAAPAAKTPAAPAAKPKSYNEALRDANPWMNVPLQHRTDRDKKNEEDFLKANPWIKKLGAAQAEKAFGITPMPPAATAEPEAKPETKPEAETAKPEPEVEKKPVVMDYAPYRGSTSHLSEDTNLDTLQGMFPSLSRKNLRRKLRKNGGDVQQVISSLVGTL